MKMRKLAKIITFYGRFTPNYTQIGYWARRLSWKMEPAPDFRGQTWLVTGASLGIGRALMQAAAEAGAEVVAVARSRERLEAARNTLPQEAQVRVRLETADLSLQSGTAQLLERLLVNGTKIDVLMNNLGLLLNELVVTTEGRETSFATNILSHYQLTEGLHRGGAFGANALIVNMTSGGMYNAPLDYRSLNVTDPARYNGKLAYAYAKRAQAALTGYWNTKWQAEGICSYVTHPGWCKTPGVKSALPVFWKIQNPILRTPRQGADTALWLCATRPSLSSEDVVWFDRKARPAHMYAFTKTPQCTVEELVAYLDAELAGREGTQASAAG
ncbi:MAG TPA: SDR family NAD(P)-dependent oxidoreductase [Xanthomonadales bacterium]|nr:SDR family NAD(P)-dependent oxidoreductase [Xanthomonadales bacterium]